jgi:hypothetical protein
MSKAIKGVYEIPEIYMNAIEIDNFKEKYVFQDYLINYLLYKHKTDNNWCLGYLNDSETLFIPIGRIWFDTEYGNKLNNSYRNIHIVDEIAVNKDYRCLGVATKLYTYFVKKHNYTLMSSYLQYFGSRKLWSALSRDNNLSVDIIDIENNKLIDKNAIIYHGDLDEEFDKRVWSYNSDAINIRLILKAKL